MAQDKSVATIVETLVVGTLALVGLALAAYAFSYAWFDEMASTFDTFNWVGTGIWGLIVAAVCGTSAVFIWNR